MSKLSVIGICVHGSQLMPKTPNAKTGQDLGTNDNVEQDINRLGQNRFNQRIKSNEEDCMDVELETVIKMLKQMKKKLEKCEKQKGHNRLIEKQSPNLTFVDKSLARNLALFGKSNRQKSHNFFINDEITP